MTIRFRLGHSVRMNEYAASAPLFWYDLGVTVYFGNSDTLYE